jgi:hypothetical protein
MFDADARGCVAQVNGRPRLATGAARKPVLIVLHQLHSNAGRSSAAGSTASLPMDLIGCMKRPGSSFNAFCLGDAGCWPRS